MKCPFRINEIHDVSVNDVTKVNMEYAECYGNECPYFGVIGNRGWCRKVAKETKFTKYCEVK